MVFERQIAEKEVISMESELDWKSSCIHVAFNLNCEILSLGFRVFERRGYPSVPLSRWKGKTWILFQEIPTLSLGFRIWKFRGGGPLR